MLNKTLPYKVYLPPIEDISKKLPVLYINDGFQYMNKGSLHNILDSLIIAKEIKPIMAVFLEPKDSTQNNRNVRQELFISNPFFVDFFTQELIPQIEKNYPASPNKEDRTILGVSFGGLAALYLADKAPYTFKNIAMQSPAFHPYQNIYNAYARKPKKDFNLFMSYGTGKDTNWQVIPMIRILKRKKYDLTVVRVKNGNHDWKTWKKQLVGIMLNYYRLH
nr:YqiA/YcfP family alpha/beta fold hydrolase [Tamlana carrageenivorans]